MATTIFQLVGVLLVASTAALAQTPLTGTAAPSPPSGVLTPAPVPEAAPGLPGVGKPVVIPEQVAPSGSTGGPATSTPFSTTPSGMTGGQPGSGAAPNLSR